MTHEEMLIFHEGLIKQLRAEVDILSKGFESLVEFSREQVEINKDIKKTLELLDKDSDNLWYKLDEVGRENG